MNLYNDIPHIRTLHEAAQKAELELEALEAIHARVIELGEDCADEDAISRNYIERYARNIQFEVGELEAEMTDRWDQWNSAIAEHETNR